MDRRELKAKLHRYGSMKEEARQIKEQIDTLEAAMYAPKVASPNAAPGGGGVGDPTAELVARHLDLLERYRLQLLRLTVEQIDVEVMLEDLEPLERTLMRHRYLEGLTWEEVCVAISYSWQQTHRIHRRALERLEEILRERESE